MSQFYVYGLVDPRTNEIFYIGKGKGNRVVQHEKEKEEIHSNTEKLRIIREIRECGMDVIHIKIAENLTEEAAFLLEKLLIYRIGRSIFDEGSLTNIAPGGKWHKDASLFLKPENIPNINDVCSQYPDFIPITDNSF